jgi:Mn2+/Fe2+ NRAMP family transporter
MTTLRRRIRSIALAEHLGPGLVTGAADDDPSGIATYSQSGAQFGYSLLWTMLLTYPLMSASAEIGRVTGRGLARNMGEIMPGPLVTGLVALLFTANTINIGADLSAMGAAAQLLAGDGAYAVGETRGWKCSLDDKPWEAVGFYAVLGAATLLGVGLDLARVDPIKALFWSAVINGVAAVPMMVAMMIVVSRPDQMGHFRARPPLRTLGWLATAVMATASAAMFATMALGGG